MREKGTCFPVVSVRGNSAGGCLAFGGYYQISHGRSSRTLRVTFSIVRFTRQVPRSFRLGVGLFIVL